MSGLMMAFPEPKSYHNNWWCKDYILKESIMVSFVDELTLPEPQWTRMGMETSQKRNSWKMQWTANSSTTCLLKRVRCRLRELTFKKVSTIPIDSYIRADVHQKTTHTHIYLHHSFFRASVNCFWNKQSLINVNNYLPIIWNITIQLETNKLILIIPKSLKCSGG